MGLGQGMQTGSSKSIEQGQLESNFDFPGMSLELNEFAEGFVPTKSRTLESNLEEPDMDYKEAEPPDPYIPEVIRAEAVDVTATKSSGGLDPTKHTIVLFKINPAPATESSGTIDGIGGVVDTENASNMG